MVSLKPSIAADGNHLYTKREIPLSTEVSMLVSRYLKGHQSAFNELFTRYQGMVFGLCLRMLGHRQEAEDAMQDTFVRVANSLQHWDSQRSFEPWLLTIAGNRCRTMLAKRFRRPKVSPLAFPVEDTTPDQHTANNLAEEMARVLQSMRADHCQAFLLFHQRQMPYQEIANVMSVPLGTVKTWVHRARQELVEQLQQRETIGSR